MASSNFFKTTSLLSCFQSVRKELSHPSHRASPSQEEALCDLGRSTPSLRHSASSHQKFSNTQLQDVPSLNGSPQRRYPHAVQYPHKWTTCLWQSVDLPQGSKQTDEHPFELTGNHVIGRKKKSWPSIDNYQINYITWYFSYFWSLSFYHVLIGNHINRQST